MEDLSQIRGETAKKMSQALEHLKQELEGVRSGRASPEILATVMVSYYGTPTPLRQLASLSAPDPQTLVATPYDPGVLQEVEKAINQAELGLHASVDSDLVRIPVPILTEERRKELVRYVHKLCENTKVVVRHLRREANEHLKRLEREKKISKDVLHDAETEIQQETDQWIEKADELVKQKEEALLRI